MEKKLVNKPGKYLYAVIDTHEEISFQSCGIDGGNVYAIPYEGLRAVVSDVDNKKMRPERRYIAAHQKVLEKLMEKTTPLPIVFGTIADDPEEVQRIILSNRTVCMGNLRRVSNKVEMGLRVTWNVPNIFEYFIELDNELRDARNRIFRGSHEPNMDEKVELGQHFDRVLREKRDEHAEKVEKILSKYCSEIKRNKPFAEHDVMNLVCLVKRDALDLFEKGVFEAAEQFDNNFTFDFNGPWAPHNFVEIDLKLR